MPGPCTSSQCVEQCCLGLPPPSPGMRPCSQDQKPPNGVSLTWEEAAETAWVDLNVAMAKALYLSALPRGPASDSPTRGGRGEATAWVAAPLGRRVYPREDYVREGLTYSPEERQLLAAQLGHFLRLAGEIDTSALLGASAPRGAVVVGGGHVLPQAMLALWSLRQGGFAEPAQLWCYSFECPSPTVEAYLRQNLNTAVVVIDRLLPALGATDGGGSAMLSRKVLYDLSLYALKVVAVTLAPFREVFLVDADNIVLRDPGPIMDSAYFQQYGAVMWPDFGGLSVDPQVFPIAARAREMAGLTTPAAVPGEGSNPRLGVAPQATETLAGVVDYEALLAQAGFAAPRQAHESGQLAVDRARHLPGLFTALFLMAYPNRALEWMLCHSLGVGDKEPFAWGITLAGGDYHMVPYPVRWGGVPGSGHGVTHVAMAQSGIDGELHFMHCNHREWTCAWLPRSMTSKERRFPTVEGRGPLQEYFRSPGWLETGGPRWGAGDLESTLWAITRGHCSLISG